MMEKKVIRLCAAVILLFVGHSASMAAPTTVMLRVSISSPTCDMAMISSSTLYFSPFTPEDFQQKNMMMLESPPVVLSLRGTGCQKTPMALNRRLLLMVFGPVGLGGRGEVWGDRNEDLAWGVRLRYRSSGYQNYLQIGPNNNQIEVNRAPEKHHLRHAGEDELVMQPEIYSWEHSRVKPGKNLMIPLVFSMVYE